VTSFAVPVPDLATVRAALRAGAGRWIARFYRHELLVARTVRGMQVEAIEEFNREVVNPLLRQVAGRLATFDLRGPDVVLELFPQLRALQAEIEATVARGSDAVRRLTTERLAELTRQETDWVRESARKVLRVEPAPVNDAAIRDKVRTRPFLGAPVEKWFAKMLQIPTGDNARAWIQTGLQQGLTTDQIVRGLRGTKAADFTDGILTGQGERAVATLVRTAATHASTVARQESFKAIGVDRYRFVATLDAKTSIQCAANDGKVFDLDGPEALPPLHPNCRSTTVPYFGDPIGNRASIDGPVPADVTFRDWLGGRPIAEQDEVLGKTRASAWRAGKLSFEQMVGRDLQPLTVAELRRLDRIPDDE
jgi:SPP1 gp7 family putative phage head morphogenesis protein